MLQPKRTKFRKEHRGRMKGIRTKGSTLINGEYGLKAEGPGWVTAREIEAARRAITGYVKRGGQLWVRLFPAKPVSARPAETRMGGGKGAVVSETGCGTRSGRTGRIHSLQHLHCRHREGENDRAGVQQQVHSCH